MNTVVTKKDTPFAYFPYKIDNWGYWFFKKDSIPSHIRGLFSYDIIKWIKHSIYFWCFFAHWWEIISYWQLTIIIALTGCNTQFKNYELCSFELIIWMFLTKNLEIKVHTNASSKCFISGLSAQPLKFNLFSALLLFYYEAWQFLWAMRYPCSIIYNRFIL